jgi:hypothetical protein
MNGGLLAGVPDGTATTVSQGGSYGEGGGQIDGNRG